MQFFVVYILTAVSFTQVMRWSQVRGADAAVVAAINFVIAAIGSVVLFVATGASGTSGSMPAILLGGANGVMYCLHLNATLVSFRLVGTGITMALTHMGCIIPVMVAHVLWPEQEPLNSFRWMAVGLVPFAVYFLKPPQTQQQRLGWKDNLLLLFVFVGIGLIFTIHKFASVFAPQEMGVLYQMLVFIVAAISTTAIMSMMGRFPGRQELRFGILAGLINSLMCRMIVLALVTLGAVVFYLCGPPVTIILNVILGRVLWGEQLHWRQHLGIILAIALVIMTGIESN